MLWGSFNGYKVALVQSLEDLAFIRSNLYANILVGCDSETTGLSFVSDYVVGICLSTGRTYSKADYVGYYIPLRHYGYSRNLPIKEVMEFVQFVIDNYMTAWWNRSFDFSMLEKDGFKAPFVGKTHDIQFMAHEVFNDRMPKLKDWAKRFLKFQTISYEENEAENNDFGSTDPEVSFIYAGGDPLITALLGLKIWSDYPNIRKIYSLDNECGEAVRRMTQQEIYLDYDFLDAELRRSNAQMESLRQQIYQLVGYSFNVDSGPQIAEALGRFVTLTVRTEKGGLKVDKNVLATIDHPLAKLLLEYSEVSTYIKSFVSKMCSWRGTPVRINYNLTVALTGRMSSSGSKGNDYYKPFNGQNCLRGDTMVFTDHGASRLDKVSVGSRVWDGDTFRDVTGFYDQGEQDVYRVLLEDGRYIDATSDHPVLTASGFVPAGSLLGSRVAINSKRVEFMTKPRYLYYKYRGFKGRKCLEWTSPDLWGLIGLLVGDGHIPAKESAISLYFDWRALDFMANVGLVLDRLGISYRKSEVKTAEGRNNIPMYVIKSVSLHRLLRRLFPHGHTAHYKVVPDILFKLPVSCRIAFLQGLYAADGATLVGFGSPRLCTVSKELAYGVQRLSTTLGVNVTVSYSLNKRFFSNRYPDGSGCGYYYTVLFNSWGYDLDLFSYCGQVKVSPDRVLSNKGKHKYRLPAELGGGAQNYNVRNDSDYLRSKYWGKVVSVEYIGRHRVYDITVAGSSRFVANGIIVHNCPKVEVKAYLHTHPVLGYCLTDSPDGAVCDSDGNPIKYKTKAGLRSAFMPAPKDDAGWVVLGADFAAQEIRVAGNLSREDGFLYPVKHNIDVHLYVAEKRFGVSDPGFRSKSKAVSFGKLYGGGPHLIASRLSISVQAAKELISDYDKGMPRLKAWQEVLKRDAKRTGFARTYFGRTIYLAKWLSSPDNGMRAYAERVSLNAPVQGSLINTIYLPSQDGKSYRPWKDFAGQRVDFVDPLSGVRRMGVPTFRGEEELHVVIFNTGDFVVCNRGHKFVKYGTDDVVIDLDSCGRIPVRMGKPFKRPRLSWLRGLFSRGKFSLEQLAALAHMGRPIAVDDWGIYWGLLKSFLGGKRFHTRSFVTAATLRSVCDLFGWNLVYDFAASSSTDYVFKLCRGRKPKAHAVFAMPLGVTHNIMSPSMCSGLPVYPLCGFVHKNTGGDLIRRDLIRLMRYRDMDPEFAANTRFVVTVHDEIQIASRIPYLAKAVCILQRIMNFWPSNFEVPLVTEPCVGLTWGYELDIHAVDKKTGKLWPKDFTPPQEYIDSGDWYFVDSWLEQEKAKRGVSW